MLTVSKLVFLFFYYRASREKKKGPKKKLLCLKNDDDDETDFDDSDFNDDEGGDDDDQKGWWWWGARLLERSFWNGKRFWPFCLKLTYMFARRGRGTHESLLGIIRAHLRYFKPEGGKSNALYQNMRSTYF